MLKPDLNKPKVPSPSKKKNSKKPLKNSRVLMKEKFKRLPNVKTGELNTKLKEPREPKKSPLLRKLKTSLLLNSKP